MPTTVAYQWGPIDATAASQTLTSQSNNITAGYYWGGIFCPSSNASCIGMNHGIYPTYAGPTIRTGTTWNGPLQVFFGLGTTPSTLAGFNAQPGQAYRVIGLHGRITV